MLKSVKSLSGWLPQVRGMCYKSDLSLEKLYPKTKTKIFTPSSPPARSDTKFNGYIPVEQLEITYSRSSGPGGQNVNMVNTKVDLRFKLDSASWIPEGVRAKMHENFKSRINKDGYFMVKSDLTRFQHMNLADALEKLRNLIRNLEKGEHVEPSVDALIRQRRLKDRANAQRLLVKRERSQIKAQRQAPIDF
ncbi:large ribosomal subunit protein mL62 [Phlebotomus argentipes]|uniref:large ribosomal subunit protein mL62 n=1 Tax=Phlebotomus argentipes TaxID=94469 RepID=UPI002892B38A|nr:large ribosomal subunit protein mL62 [Phlebotomus argentipes]